MKKKSVVERPLPPFLAGLCVRMNNGLKSLAQVLSAVTSRWSRARVKLALFGFCAAFSFLSVLIVVRSLRSHAPFRVVAPMQTIRLPPVSINQARIGKERIRIHQFKRYLDSLSATPQGKQVKDSLLLLHPHLMDSVSIIENLFYDAGK